MYIKSILFLVFFTIFLLIGCKNEIPNGVWDPNSDGRPQPVIQSVFPTEGSYAGIQVITLNGSNFSRNPKENILTVKGNRGVILSATETQITAIPPLVISDSATLRLDVIGSYESGKYYPYRLISPANVYGNFTEDEFVQDIEFDKDNNLYALITNATGQRIIYKQIAEDTTRIEYGRVNFPIGQPSMKFGPDGSLFICRKNNKKFYRIPPGGGNAEQYVRLPGKVQTFDFDTDGNIYIGGSGNSIYRIKGDKTIETVADYDTIAIVSLRLFENYVYIAGQYKQQTPEGLKIFQKIWRNSIISSSDSLGSKELVFDWSDYNSENLISAITFSAEGDLYISSNAENPVTVIYTDKSVSPFLEGVLPPPAIGLAWDESDFFYYIHKVEVPAKKEIIRVYTAKRGAVYNGRQ